MVRLQNLIDQLEAQIPNGNVLNEKVSASPVSWHIEHSLLVIDITLLGLKKSNAGDYKWEFSFWRWVTFTLNKFPRGRAKAPKAVQPAEWADTAALQAHAVKTRESLKEFLQLDPMQFMKHPIFGKLNLKHTLRFLDIHTRHHLAIINDILKSQVPN